MGFKTQNNSERPCRDKWGHEAEGDWLLTICSGSQIYGRERGLICSYAQFTSDPIMHNSMLKKALKKQTKCLYSSWQGVSGLKLNETGNSCQWWYIFQTDHWSKQAWLWSPTPAGGCSYLVPGDGFGQVQIYCVMSTCFWWQIKLLLTHVVLNEKQLLKRTHTVYDCSRFVTGELLDQVLSRKFLTGVQSFAVCWSLYTVWDA